MLLKKKILLFSYQGFGDLIILLSGLSKDIMNHEITLVVSTKTHADLAKIFLINANIHIVKSNIIELLKLFLLINFKKYDYVFLASVSNIIKFKLFTIFKKKNDLLLKKKFAKIDIPKRINQICKFNSQISLIENFKYNKKNLVFKNQIILNKIKSYKKIVFLDIFNEDKNKNYKYLTIDQAYLLCDMINKKNSTIFLTRQKYLIDEFVKKNNIKSDINFIDVTLLKFSELISLLHLADFTICVDSFLSHLAANFCRNNLGIYGASDPNYSGIINYKDNNNIIFQNFISCSPCSPNFWTKKPGPCNNPTCMSSIKIESIFKSIEHLI